MIFMSQSGLLEPSEKQEQEWDEWYVEHCRAMATVPGIPSAQRFRTETPGAPPSLAMYSIDGPEVFDDATYLSVRGFREWQPMIDRHFYRRNLFAGLDLAPPVDVEQLLLVADRAEPEQNEPEPALTWLEAVGLDHSTPYRGIVVLAGPDAPSAGPDTAVYRPVTRRFGDTS